MAEKEDQGKRYLAEYLTRIGDPRNPTWAFWKNELNVLSWPEMRILAILDEEPFFRLEEIAKRLEYSPRSTSLAQHLEHLSELGLIRYVGYPENSVLIMDKGKHLIALIKEVEQIIEDTKQEFQAKFEQICTERTTKHRVEIKTLLVE